MISKENLELLCELSKLHLTEEEFAEYGKEMTDIISLMDTIGESDFEYNLIDTTNAVPFSELRADEIETFDNMKGIVDNGPQTVANQFVVPKIVD
ncbi:MAG: Asp-tRNA(Asn)/Glu-tRNA(Gln) amidotransferase subunit GatC [Clostridia bacterium]|nr:Asp-tRNA(Asn)/Glu-tRNA(Gln) amidotransferase subunit GatC [Clostridia bacterium]